ncbi:unnamed protein product, partial [Durusdinium trenchii]
MEIFDLTQDDSPDEPVQSEDEEMAWAINMVMEVQDNALEEEEVFYDCHSGDEDEPPSTSSLEETGSHDARAQCEDTELDMFRVCMVKSVAPTVIMTLDSGADVSVAPEEYNQMGQPGQQRSVQMVDAQGEAIKSAGNRRLRLQAHTRSGEMVEFVEQFALGVGVTHPLLSFGRLLRQGWVLSRDQQGLCLEHPEKKMQIPARLERNSLVMDVKVCAIRAEEDVDEEQKKEIEAMAANDRAQAMNEGEERKEEKKIPEEAEADRGVKRSAEEQIELERVAKEEDETLAVMKELSEQVVTDDDVQVEENPMKKSRLKENEDIPQRSPGYTTEESGGEIMVEGSSSEDGRVQEKMARWEKWRLKKIEVKSEPMELTDSPMEELMEAGQHVFPVRGEGHSLQGFISRELGLLEKVPGWHALPNGIVVHSSPQATHFLDPSMSFGPEWCGRMTLVKKKDNSGAWEQIESLAAYRDTPLPFRALPAGPRSALTFVAPGLIRDYFVLNSEVPVSQYPLLSGEPSSWPDDERDEEGGEFPMLAAGSGGRAEILEDVEFVDPDELRVQIDETWFDKETKLKDLQEICKQLGLATSGSKTKVLRRLQRFKHQQEEKMAYEVAQRLFAESRREAIPLKTPKLPSRHEQELRQLTHLPFQPWCQQCVATRSKEDPRMKEDQSDRKDRGRPVISFDCGFTYTADAPEEKQWGTALYVAESESKATLCIPVQAKGSASLKQAAEEATGPKEAHQKVQAEEIEVSKRKMARLPIPEAMRGEPARNFMPEALESEASPKKQRPDKQHIKELAKLTNVEHRKHRTTPGDGTFNRLSKDDEPMKYEDITKYRSCVGKLLYISPDRPDVQYVAQGLAGFMQQPTKKSWQAMQHVSSYLLGTMDEGLLFEHGPEHGPRGRSMLNDDDNIYEWDLNEEKKSMPEVVCDADHAGQRDTRKSVSSVQIYLDGCLLESCVRSQRVIALSSGESEYVAMVGGCSEGLFLKHCWKFLTNEDLDMICRSDSSAARALAGRVGVGRTRHIAAGLLWLQQKVVAKELRITGIPTAVNTSDIGTKVLSRARMSGLKFLIKMVDMDDEKIGKQQYEEIKAKEQLKKNTGKMAKMMGANAKVALVIALSLLQGGLVDSAIDHHDLFGKHWGLEPGTNGHWGHEFVFHEEPIEENENEGAVNVVARPLVRNEANTDEVQRAHLWQNEDEEKVNMQWQIVRLEVAIAEHEEKLTDARRDRDLQAREVVRMYNMCSELRFELENVKEERDEAKRKAIRLAGTDDEKAMEMERMAEDTAKAWEVAELWKKRSKETENEAKQQMT